MPSPRLLPSDFVRTPRPNTIRMPTLTTSLTLQYGENGKLVLVGSENARLPEPPARERRVIRFTGPKRRPAKPITTVQPLKSTSDLGFAAPHLSAPRHRSAGFLEDERRRRLVEASYFERESLLSRDAPEEAREEEEGATLQPTDLRQHTSSTANLSSPHHCPYCGSNEKRTPHNGKRLSSTLSSVQYIPAETGQPAARSSQSQKGVRAKLRMEDVKGSAAYAIPPNESSTEGKMEELAELHNKLDGWYQDIVDADNDFRSDVLFLEMKMQELLGPSWPERKSEPDIIRTSVFCDMLGRLISSTPAITKLGTALLDELMASIYHQKGREIGGKEEPQTSPHAEEQTERPPLRGAAILQMGQPYFSTVRKLQVQVEDLQETVLKLRKDRLSEEEETNSKIKILAGRIMGRLGDQSFHLWKRRAQRGRVWKDHYAQLHRKRVARWKPFLFFKWLASTEEGKTARWKRVAEMLKWERDYGPGKADGPETPSSEGSRRSNATKMSVEMSVDMLRTRSRASSVSSQNSAGLERGRMLWGAGSSAGGDELSYRTAKPDDASHRTAWGGGVETQLFSASEQHSLSPPEPSLHERALVPSPPRTRTASVGGVAGELEGESEALHSFKPDPDRVAI